MKDSNGFVIDYFDFSPDCYWKNCKDCEDCKCNCHKRPRQLFA